MNRLAQMYLDINQDIYFYFVQFEKGFDKIKHGKLVETLKGKYINSRNVRNISRFYWNQTQTKVKVEN